VAAAVASFGFYHIAGIFPFNLRMDRYYALTEPEFWRWYAAGLVAIVVWLAVCRRFAGRLRRSGAWRGLLWFLMFWFVQSNIPFVLNAHFAEHWMYFAYLGLAWAAADAWSEAKDLLPEAIRQAVVILALCLGFLWAGRSFMRQPDWRDDYVFFESNIRAGADTSRSHKSLALAYARDQRFAEAVPHFVRAVEKDPRDFGARWALARCYFFGGDYAKAAALASELRNEYPKDIVLEGFESHCRKALEERKRR
jgi:tetratricopeptide (TPR) repeat protein